MTSTTEVKKALRKQIRAAKNAVPFCEKLSRSETLMAQVEKLEQFQNARTVLLYWSMDDEVQTHDFVNRWYKEMQAGEQFGIGEPTGPEFTNLESIDMIIVPGVAFDREGNRMGRGRGFYDRLLSTTPNAFKVGVAFGFQMVEQVPTEPFDIKMNKVIHE